LVGTLDNNLRSGYLHEDLGIFLLRQIAAVASVPRPQDIGLDAICTILEPIDKRRLQAGSSFWVQLKAKSIRTIEYCYDELQWINDFKIPFFIGSVDMETGSISLYTLFNLYESGKINDFVVGGPSVILTLGESPREEQVDRRRVYLGKPIITWSMKNSNEETFYSKIFNLLNSWIAEENVNIFLRKHNCLNTLSWDTNEKPYISGSRMSDSDIISSIKDILPVLKRIAFYFINSRNQQGWDSMKKLFLEFQNMKIDIIELVGLVPLARNNGLL